MMRPIAAAIALIALIGAPALDAGIDLSSKTVEAFERYVRDVEAAVEVRTSGKKAFLWASESPGRLDRVRRGEVVIERTRGTGPTSVTDGLIHDWIGAVFVPGVTLAQTLDVVQDYARHKTIYPEVMDSQVRSREGDRFMIFLRLKKKKIITVVLDTTHDARYFRLDATRAYSRSRTTRVEEVEGAGTADERQLAPGTGGGYMWALNSYWRFAAGNGGVFVECQAVSLSRSIPIAARLATFGLIDSIVNDLPRESLEGTLVATREAVQKQAHSQSAAAPARPIGGETAGQRRDEERPGSRDARATPLTLRPPA